MMPSVQDLMRISLGVRVSFYSGKLRGTIVLDAPESQQSFVVLSASGAYGLWVVTGVLVVREESRE